MVGRYYKVSEYIKDISYLPANDKNYPANKIIDDFFAFSGIDEDNIKKQVIKKPLSYRPEINLVLLDWDGTVGDSYNELGKLIRTLIFYLSKSRNLSQTNIIDILDFECKRRENFGFEDFFSVYGIKKILGLPLFSKDDFSVEDNIFLENNLNKDLESLYTTFYPFVRDFLEKMQKADIDVFILTDTPLSEQIDKMKLSEVIAFKDKGEGRKELSYSLISGISTRKDIHDRPYPEAEIKALEESGKIVISNYHVKPHNEAMDKISLFFKQKGIEIKPENILVIGDSLNRDGLFALTNKTHFLFSCLSSWYKTFCINFDFSKSCQEIFNPNIFSKLKDIPNSPVEDKDQPLFENYHHEISFFDYENLSHFYNFQPLKNKRIKG